MRIAMFTPLPPARTGVAHYASMLLPALSARAAVKAFASAEEYYPEEYDGVVYQLGNNPFHELAYAEAMRRPGVAVLHDLVLHHLIVEMTLARGNAEAYVAALEANHGQAGAAWARGRAAGLHSEMGNFLFPASISVANRSRAVIVHNRWAADKLRSFGVETPIHVVPHPFEQRHRPVDREAIRSRLGFAPGHRVIGLFGFLTSAKRGEVVVEAFRMARTRQASLRLLIAGEPAPNIDMSKIAGDGVVITGYAADADFDGYYAAADRFVNLRYPSAGETSGTLVRALAAGKPVAVSDYAQFAELPDDVVVKIPFDDEVERLADFLADEVRDPAPAQQQWLEENARPDKTVQGYLAALSGAPPASPVENAGKAGGDPLSRRAGGDPLAIFPALSIAHVAKEGRALLLTLRNDGRDVVRARSWGQPAYRALVKVFDGARQIQDHWMALPGDVAPGHSVQLTLPLYRDVSDLSLRLHHALEGVPIVDSSPAESVRVR